MSGRRPSEPRVNLAMCERRGTGMHVWMPLIRTATGSETYTWRLAKGLRARGHQVTVSDVAHAYQYFPWAAPIQPPKDTTVILANSWNAAAFAYRNRPLVSVCHLVVHDPALTTHKSFVQRLFHARFVRPMERASVAKADVNVAVSGTVARQMRCLLDADEVTVVFNGVDATFWCPPTAPPAENTAPLRLLFVGKPSLRKGFDTVARVVERLADKVTFTSIGPEPDRRLPRPPGTYTGPMGPEDLRAAYRAADLLLLPSRMEGFGLVAAEAMACGLPVAGSVETPVAEVVTEDCGLLLGADDDAGFASAIEALAEDRTRLAAMRIEARVRAVQHLSDTRWIDGMEAVLRSAESR